MRPILSILIPFYRDDPSDLLSALLPQSPSNVQICLYDDGTGDTDVHARLNRMKKAAIDGQVKLMFETENKGRSQARNALFKAADAAWVLFLDADMLPVDGQFVDRYLDAIKSRSVQIIFGGFLMAENNITPETALHHAFSKTSDCLNAQERNQKGPQYVCSSNLAVRADVLMLEPFDTGFEGWGWEDSEWAARVCDRFKLIHMENPAYHLGLESTQTLLSRFKNSAANYERFTNRHPAIAHKLALYTIKERLIYMPGQGLLRPVLKLIVSTSFAPMRLRLACLKLWRASWYALYSRNLEREHKLKNKTAA